MQKTNEQTVKATEWENDEEFVRDAFESKGADSDRDHTGQEEVVEICGEAEGQVLRAQWGRMPIGNRECRSL